MSEFISLSAAEQMTTSYRENRPGFLKEQYSVDILPICETFDKSQVEALLGQDGSTQLRAYLGTDENNNIKILLVGVNDSDEDILVTGSEKILDRAKRCPVTCPPSSPLNS